MTEKRRLRELFTDYTEKCTLCFRERVDNGKDIEKCEIGCQTYKKIADIRKGMQKIRCEVVEDDTSKYRKDKFDCSLEEYCGYKELGMSDTQIAEFKGVSAQTIKLHKRKWGIVQGRKQVG